MLKFYLMHYKGKNRSLPLAEIMEVIPRETQITPIKTINANYLHESLILRK